MTEHLGDLHIDDFCKDTAKILLVLYKRFPVKSALYVEDISGSDEPDEFGLHSPRFSAGFCTLLWLKETDYIQFSKTIFQEGVEEAVLTHRAFSLLSAYDDDPSSQKKSSAYPPRRIDKLKDAVKNASSEALKERVLALMTISRNYS